MDIYQEKILDHYHDPHNYGEIKNPTHKHCKKNPTCGDDICVTILVENNIIKDVKFTGEGCAISQAATSLVTDAVKEKSVEEVFAIGRNQVIELLGTEVGMGRIRCTLLGIETIQKALEYGEVTNEKR